MSDRPDFAVVGRTGRVLALREPAILRRWRLHVNSQLILTGPANDLRRSEHWLFPGVFHADRGLMIKAAAFVSPLRPRLYWPTKGHGAFSVSPRSTAISNHIGRRCIKAGAAMFGGISGSSRWNALWASLDKTRRPCRWQTARWDVLRDGNRSVGAQAQCPRQHCWMDFLMIF